MQTSNISRFCRTDLSENMKSKFYEQSTERCLSLDRMTLTLWACFCVPSNRKFTLPDSFSISGFHSISMKNSLRVNDIGVSVNLDGDSQLIHYLHLLTQRPFLLKGDCDTTVILNVGVTGSLRRLSPDYFGFPAWTSFSSVSSWRTTINTPVYQWIHESAKGKGNWRPSNIAYISSQFWWFFSLILPSLRGHSVLIKKHERHQHKHTFNSNFVIVSLLPLSVSSSSSGQLRPGGFVFVVPWVGLLPPCSPPPG